MKENPNSHNQDEESGVNGQSRSSDEFDEILEFDGLVIARKGRFIFTENLRSEEEHVAHMKMVLEKKDEFWQSIEEQVVELEDIIVNFHPLDLIANISLRNKVLDPETYSEPSHDGNDAYTEYLALLCLTKPYSEFQSRSTTFIDGNVVEDVQERIKKIFSSILFYIGIKDIDPDDPLSFDELSGLRRDSLARSLLIRYSSHFQHLLDVLIGIFSPINDELSDLFGFNIEDCIEIINGFDALISDRMMSRRDKARKHERDFRRAVKQYRLKKKLIGDYSEDIIKPIASLKPSEANYKIRNTAIAWVFFAIGDTFSFSAEELADSCNVNPTVVKSFLDLMSIEFGSVEERYRFPSPTHPLMKFPFIKQDDTYFCPNPNQIAWSIQPAFEEFLNPESQLPRNSNTDVWEKYVRNRARFLEDTTFDYLSLAIKPDKKYQRLHYDYEINGEIRNCELDGLAILDTTLFLVECKSGSLSWPARRGAPSLTEDIDALIGDAYLQAKRAQDFINSQSPAIFQLEDNREIQIDKDSFSRMVLITTTLDELDAFNANLYQLQALGLFQDNSFPWAVSLTNLRVISEIIEFPAQFIHYLSRRLRLNEIARVRAIEELDWLGHYLAEGLYFEDLPSDPDYRPNVSIGNYSTKLDDYFFYITGLRRTPAEKPSQAIPDLLKEILIDMESIRPPGYIEASTSLLDMGSDSRDDFCAAMIEQRNASSNDREPHDFSFLFFDPGFGITYMFLPSEYSREISVRLPGYCSMKKYQTKIEKWIGLACIVDAPGWVHSGVVMMSPWEYDEELEGLVSNNLGPIELPE